VIRMVDRARVGPRGQRARVATDSPRPGRTCSGPSVCSDGPNDRP
jgi:hypothetical protein